MKEIEVTETDVNGIIYRGTVLLWEKSGWVHHILLHVRYVGSHKGFPENWTGDIEKLHPETRKKMELSAFNMYMGEKNGKTS